MLFDGIGPPAMLVGGIEGIEGIGPTCILLCCIVFKLIVCGGMLPMLFEGILPPAPLVAVMIILLGCPLLALGAMLLGCDIWGWAIDI